MTPAPSPSRPASGRGRRARAGALRVGVGVAVVVAVVGAVVGAVPVPTLAPSAPGSSGSPVGVIGGLLTAPSACAAPASDGTIAVAVAVDPGGVSGMSGGPETMCVTVPAGASGADVLVARARALGRPAPRYNSAGLLCSIDGQPATGCGERVDGAYRYWAYFLGTGGWSYAGTGPALRRASAGTAEGWRFVAGAGNASDPPPRATASPTAICPPPPPPTTVAPVVPAPVPTNPGPVPDPGDGSSMGGPGSRGNATVGDRGAAPGSDDAGGDAAGADASGGEVSTVDDEGSGGDGARRGDGGDEVAGAPVVDTSSGGGPPVGALLAVVLLVVLAVGALVQVRRRGAT